MTTAELIGVAMKLGNKATQMELTLEYDPESVPSEKLQQYKELYRLLFAGEAAINALLEQRDHIKATLWSTQRELDFNKTTLKEIISKNYG